MPDISWVQVAVSFASGGAFGAVINNVVSVYRARVQPVGVRTDVVRVLHHAGGPTGIDAKIAVTHAGGTDTFDNLFLIGLQVVNKGNLDHDGFDFGATLDTGDVCIHVEAEGLDRHHQAQLMTPVTPQSPRNTIDVQLKPFNRGDPYSLKLYVVIGKGNDQPSIDLSSPKAVRFVEMPTIGEMVARAASEAVIRVGPLSIGLRR